MKFSGKVDSGPVNKRLNLVAIRITDPDPDRDTNKTYLGRGMHYTSASSFRCYNRTYLYFLFLAKSRQQRSPKDDKRDQPSSHQPTDTVRRFVTNRFIQ